MNKKLPAWLTRRISSKEAANKPTLSKPPSDPETCFAAAFAVLAGNPIFAGWTREDMDLAFVGALAAQVSALAAQEALPALLSLRVYESEEALRRGGEAWDRMLTEVDKEVAKLGGGAAADAARNIWAKTGVRAANA